jgi:hypothetical protein
VFITFRTDDPERWGFGKGSNLTATEVDINFWELLQRLLNLEEHPNEGVGIDHFAFSGSQMTVYMTDHTTRGPYDVPAQQWRFRGAWHPGTVYTFNDVVTVAGLSSVFLVLVTHLSADEFDPGANDGEGHDYYGLLLANPENALPTGGGTGQVLSKASGADFDLVWADIPVVGLPSVLTRSGPMTVSPALNNNYVICDDDSSEMPIFVNTDATMAADGLTMPSNFQCHFRQAGTAPLVLVPEVISGVGEVTINPSRVGHDLNTHWQGAVFTLIRTGVNAYDMIGPPGTPLSGFSG